MANNSVVLLQSASRTVAPTAVLELAAGRQFVEGVLNSAGCWELVAVVDVTVNAGGLGSITLSISGFDKASGKTWLILASVALTAVATTVYRVALGAVAAANLVANDVVPAQIKVSVAHNNANPITYSVGLHFAGG